MKKIYLLIIIILCLALAGVVGFGVFKATNKKEPQEEIVEQENQVIVIEEPEIEIPKVLNFNDYYEVAYDETAALQEKVDAGYLVGAYGDYYHHNTKDFTDLFWILDKVEEIQIDGKSYTFVGYTTAVLQLDDGSIKMEDGTIVEYNDRTEIITCQAEEENPARFVAILKDK